MGGIKILKKLNKKIIPILIFLVGSSIFLYPIISNYINSKTDTKMIYDYEKEVAKMSQAEKEEKIRIAKEYNKNLVDKNISNIDPFTNENAGSKVISVLNIGEIMGYLEIPKLDVKNSIYEGASEAVLQKGVGWMDQTSLPIGGESTHSVLTAHRGLPSSKLFRDLDKLEIDDEFYIHGLEGTMAYKINEIQVFLPEEIDDKLSVYVGEDYITLLTCEPYMINSHRLLVRGERIDYKEDGSLKDIEKLSFVERNLEYIIIVGVFILLIILLLIIKEIKKKLGRKNEKE